MPTPPDAKAPLLLFVLVVLGEGSTRLLGIEEEEGDDNMAERGHNSQDVGRSRADTVG